MSMEKRTIKDIESQRCYECNEFIEFCKCHETEETTNLENFKKAISKNKCPFCGKELEFHSGLLGYESYNCYDCGLEIDNNGMRLLTPHKEMRRVK